MKYCFLGYPDKVKMFKLWDPIQSKCVIYRDVIFRENEMYYMSNTDSKGESIKTKKHKLNFDVELGNRQGISEF